MMKHIELTLRERSTPLPSGCIEWTGTRDIGGYGVIQRRVNGRRVTIKAHRAAWEIKHGPVPDGMKVCHRCDNRACINDAHHFLGTQADNLADMTSKGRARRHLGGRPHKFSEGERRALLASGKHPNDIAREAGVNRATVYRWISDLGAQ